jgi:hypothetical protein
MHVNISSLLKLKPIPAELQLCSAAFSELERSIKRELPVCRFLILVLQKVVLLQGIKKLVMPLFLIVMKKSGPS